MSHLVEQKLKKLHYFPPNFRVQPPHSILAAHPLLASVPKKAFRKEVSPTACATCNSDLQTLSIACRLPSSGLAQVQTGWGFTSIDGQCHWKCIALRGRP